MNMNKEQNTSQTTDPAITVDTVLAPVFTPPFRVGRKQMRAVLDAKGREVVIFPNGLQTMAIDYVQYLNRTHSNGC